MLEVFNDLRVNRRILETGSGQEYLKTSTEIANRYGYRHIGMSTELHAIFFGRNGSNYSQEAMTRALERLRMEGYRIGSLAVSIHGLGYLQCNSIEGKHYDAGNVAVRERGHPDPRKPIVIAGHNSQGTLIGLFLDTSPEHVGIVDEIARYIGMEPRTKKADNFRAFIEELTTLDNFSGPKSSDNT